MTSNPAPAPDPRAFAVEWLRSRVLSAKADVRSAASWCCTNDHRTRLQAEIDVAANTASAEEVGTRVLPTPSELRTAADRLNALANAIEAYRQTAMLVREMELILAPIDGGTR